ncbi:MAG: pilus assembly protein TadG-related protein [Siculibacillus sp.]|nr:pilus assembly protein TadG-related protein [Siculibacillus sp.]
MFNASARSLLALTRTIAGDRRASIGTTFALALVPMVMATGAAVDWSRAVLVRADLQQAVDAAALATARAQADGVADRTRLAAIARSSFDANYRSAKVAEVSTSDLTVATEAGGRGIGLTASTMVETTLTRVAGVDRFDVAATAHAVIDKKDFEISMMFDVTGSMADAPKAGGPAKISSLKTAAGDFVDTLMPKGGRFGSGKVRIATVPFSQGVNAGAFAGNVSGGKSASCVVEREGMGATDDLAPTAAPLVRPTDMACPKNRIAPLSADRTSVLAAVTGLSATGATAGHIGTAWAWYTLSPKWNSIWPGSAAAPAGDGVRKIAVLMTDGLYNTVYRSGHPAQDALARSQANARAVALCQGMRKAGIAVYAIGFDVTDPQVKATLSACASPLSGGATAYFDAADGAALKAAYDEIARQIRDNLRLAG